MRLWGRSQSVTELISRVGMRGSYGMAQSIRGHRAFVCDVVPGGPMRRFRSVKSCADLICLSPAIRTSVVGQRGELHGRKRAWIGSLASRHWLSQGVGSLFEVD